MHIVLPSEIRETSWKGHRLQWSKNWGS